MTRQLLCTFARARQLLCTACHAGTIEVSATGCPAMRQVRAALPNADHAYEFSLGQKLTGYLVSRRGNDQAFTFVHLFDERDRHHQLIFSSFNEQQITCTLNRIAHVW